MGIDQKIKVCHLISGDLWAGAEVQACTLLTALKEEASLDLTAIVLNEGRLTGQLRAEGVETLVIDETRHGFGQIYKKLREELTDRKIDILHSHRYKENILAARLKKAGLTRYLVQTVHGTGERFKGLNRLKMKVYNYLNSRQTKAYFDRVIAVSKDIHGLYDNKLPKGRTVTIHNAVAAERLQPTRPVAEMRRELKIGSDSPVIGTAGRLVPVKGYDLFLEAARFIIEDKPEAVILIAGDGPLMGELKQRATALGIDNNVRFLGFREDIVDILNCLDIFVMSSHHEGIPMVLLEAMALRKPVVSTAVGGVREVIKDNLSGLLVKPGDVKALALACLIVLNRPETRTSLSLGARKRIEEEFSVAVQKKRMLELYRGLTGQK
jgi:glycosyltransferase involved in cell wall biosynthesis